jgi:hypothetical protein
MQQGITRDPNNPHKGLDGRKFMLAVFVALVVFFIGMYGWTRYSAATGKPNVQTPGHLPDGNTPAPSGR